MQAKLVEQDHGQQVGAGASARDRMEGRRRLGDGPAITADELLADGLQHDPLPWHNFETVGLGLADLLELSAAAARAVLWCGHDNTVTRQMLWQGAADGLAAGEGCDGNATGLRLGHDHLGRDFVFGGGGNEIFELHLELVEETAATFGRLPRSDDWPHLSARALAICSLSASMSARPWATSARAIAAIASA